MGEITARDQLQLVFALVGAFCALIAGVVGFIIRLEIKRVYALVHQLETEATRRQRWEGWITTVLVKAGVLQVPDAPD